MTTQPDRVLKGPDLNEWDWEIQGLKRTIARGTASLEGDGGGEFTVVLDHRARILTVTSTEVNSSLVMVDFLRYCESRTHTQPFEPISLHIRRSTATVEDVDRVFGLLHLVKETGMFWTGPTHVPRR